MTMGERARDEAMSEDDDEGFELIDVDAPDGTPVLIGPDTAHDDDAASTPMAVTPTVTAWQGGAAATKAAIALKPGEGEGMLLKRRGEQQRAAAARPLAAALQPVRATTKPAVTPSARSHLLNEDEDDDAMTYEFSCLKDGSRRSHGSRPLSVKANERVGASVAKRAAQRESARAAKA